MDLIPAAALPLTGCAPRTKSGLPIFPLGLYTAHDTAEIERILDCRNAFRGVRNAKVTRP